MKSLFLVILFISLPLFPASIPELLRDFRQNTCLEFGVGYGRSPEQVLKEGHGTHIELTNAFKSILEKEGYSCKIVLGTIQLTDTQKNSWHPIGWERISHLLGSDGTTLPFSWLQVDAPVLPDMLTRNTFHSPYAMRTIDLFPALNGFELLSDDANAQLEETPHLDETGIHAIQWGETSPAPLTFYPFQHIWNAISSVYVSLQGFDCRECITHQHGIAGNIINPQFSPVKILSRDYIGEGIPETAISSLTITISCEDRVLMTTTLPQHLVSELDVEWLWGDNRTLPQAGDPLEGRSLEVRLTQNGNILASGSNIPPMATCSLTISREVPAFGCTDTVKGIIQAGGLSKIHLSPSNFSALPTPLDQLCEKTSASRKTALLAANVTDISQLKGTVLTFLPQLTTNNPQCIHSFIPALSPLVQADTSHLITQETLSGIQRKITINLLSALTPLAAIHRLQWENTPISLLSSIYSNDPFRASHITLQPSISLPNEFFKTPIQKVIQVNDAYPRHIIAIQSDGRSHVFSQYSASSIPLPSPLFFPAGLSHDSILEEKTEPAWLPALVARQLGDLNTSSLPCETLALADATVIAWSACFDNDSIGQDEPSNFQLAPERPALTLNSAAFDGNEHIGDIEVIANVTNLLPVRIELLLNGKHYAEINFPEVPLAMFTIASEDLKDGVNTVTARAWNSSMQPSDDVERRIVAPILTSFEVSPHLVQTWNGTNSTITLKASTRNPQHWIAILSGNGVERCIENNTTSINASFNTSELPDGNYTLTLTLPTLSAAYSVVIEIDNVQGTPLAQITYPEEDATIHEGILAIQGTATATNDDAVCYHFTLTDEYGKPIQLETEEHNGGLRLVAVSLAEPKESPTPRSVTHLEQTELAKMDLTSLPNGLYTLTLFVTASGVTASDSVSFSLQSDLKIAPLTFTEEDFTIQAGSVPIKVSRHYNSQGSWNMGYGVGWQCNKEFQQPHIDETREEIDTLDDGVPCSIRTGGTRDVTVTLSNGQRTRFRFELVPGGGWSFCYYAMWKAPEGIQATLVPTCSNKLMTLTGLEPYWEAAGPETPWQLFDFPGFNLTEADGTVSTLSRDLLAEVNILENADLPIAVEDGEPVFIQAYGELKLASQLLPNGRTFLFDDNAIYTLLDGIKCKLFEQTWDENKTHVLSAKSYLLNGVETEVDTTMQYEYDGDNLVAVKRSRKGEPFKHFRYYEYEDKNLPHYITAVKNGNGDAIISAQYDKHGHVSTATGANGEAISAQRDTFAGFESRTDALGRETIIHYDIFGSILQETSPNGAIRTFQYDEQHKEIAVTDAYGNTTSKGYDENGNLASITRPDGATATFQYDGQHCTQATDFNGNNSYFSHDAKGYLQAFKAPNGNMYSVARDNDGNVTSLSRNGHLISQSMYDASGRLSTVTDYATGTQYGFTHDNSGNTTETLFTIFDPNTGEEVTHTLSAQYDAENRLVSNSSSDGFWETFQYDSNGKMAKREESNGQIISCLYDRSGEIVQIKDENNMVTRYGRDASGQIIFIAGPEQTDSPSNTIVFKKALRYDYDNLACITKTTEVDNAKVMLQSTGIDCYQADMVSWENPISAYSSYDLKGRLTATQTKEGFLASFEYNASDKLASLTDHFGNKTLFEYNTAGRITKTIMPDNSSINYVYDNCGHPLEITDPLGNKQHLTYNNDGKLLSCTAPDNSMTCYEYDENGLLQSATLSSNTEAITYLYEYDSSFSLSSIQTPSGQRTSYTNDCLGRRITTKLPLGQCSSTRYETPGVLPIEHTDFAGNRIMLNYNALGKAVKKSIIPPGETSPEKNYRYHYLPSGNLAMVVLEHGFRSSQISCVYNDSNHLISFKTPYFTANNQYDLDGRLSAFSTDSTTFSISREKSNPQSVMIFTKASGTTLTQKDVFTTTYDSLGRVHSIATPDSMVRQYEYDAAGSLSTLKALSKTGEEIYSFSCTRDSCGRLLTSSESILNQKNNKEFMYDEYGRLTSESWQCNDNLETSSHFYDKNGNISRTLYSNSREAPVCRSYDDNGRLVGIEEDATTTILTWDDNGSLLSICEYDLDERITFSQSFTWDCEGLLQKIVTSSQGKKYTTSYEYDANATLCGSICFGGNADSNHFLYNHRYFYYAPGNKGIPLLMEVEELDEDGHVVHRQANVWENGLVGFFFDGQFHTCICDAGGSIIAIQSHGDSWEKRQYTAWGLPIDTTEQMKPTLAFRGELYFPANGLLYLRSRFYMPRLGIFISADRQEPNLMIPQEFNRYAYCRNDPVNRVDPMGTFSILALPMNIGLRLGTAIYTGISVELSIETIYSAYLSHEMTVEFSSPFREKDNATVIVHGVWKHEPGYASDFVSRLQRYAPNQEYLQFRWSGFGGILPMFVPNFFQHNLAQNSLEFCLGCLKSKGYANINVIGHSWGTVLSKDALNSGVINVGLWATMGSPLADDTQYDLNGNQTIPPSFPLFNHDKWMNFYNECDPVVHLHMNGPLISPTGAYMIESGSTPIFESPLPEQYNLGFITPDVHGCYWYNPTTILAITLFTKRQ